MEVTTKEVIRYIDLRFKEQDLKKMWDEIELLNDYFKIKNYPSDKQVYEQLTKLKEFQNVLSGALSEIKE